MDDMGLLSAACHDPPQYQSTVRTVWETILWIAVIAAYIPQYHRIRWEGTSGLSPYYILNHCLFSTTTLALRLSHRVFYTAFNCVASGELSAWKGYSAALGFIEVIVQWLCAVLLLAIYTRHRTPDAHPEETLSRTLSATARDLPPQDDPTQTPHKLTSPRMWTIWTTYTLSTLPTSLALLLLNTHPYFTHNPARHDAVYVGFWSVWVGFLCLADAFLVVFQFIKQMKTVGRLRTRGRLSVAAVAAQSVTFVLLSMSQLFRSRRNIVVRHPDRGGGGGGGRVAVRLDRLLRLLVYVYGCVSVDVMYLVAGLGYLVLFQLCLVFDWNDLFGRRFGRIQLL